MTPRPVKLLVPWSGWPKGHVFTQMQGNQAREMINRNMAVYADTAPPAQVDRMMRPSGPPPVQVLREQLVAIPEDWRSGNHMRRITLARNLTTEKVPTEAAAVAVIEAEIARRRGE